MQYYDQHLHTFLSFDSEEQFENYLAYQPEIFVATDHLDLKNPCSQYQDDIPDYEKLVQKHHELADKYPTRLLKGIELGVVPGQERQIQDYLASHPYDLKLLSIHQNGQFDYMDDVVLSKDKFEVASEYFNQMEHVLKSFSGAQILTHFEYGLRRLAFTPEELGEHYEKQLTRILQLIIEKEMALELNAKSYGKYQNKALYDYIIPLYRSLGGQLFTLGSDAHVVSDYRLLFADMSHLLEKHGVKQLAVYLDGNWQLTPLAK